MDDYSEFMQVSRNYHSSSKALLGTVCATDAKKRTMKIILEPDGVETGWCRAIKGSFTEKTGVEVVVLAIGRRSCRYIVCGIIDEPDESE